MGLKYFKMSHRCRNEEEVIRLDKMSNQVRQHVNNTESLCLFVLFVVNLDYSLGYKGAACTFMAKAGTAIAIKILGSVVSLRLPPE